MSLFNFFFGSNLVLVLVGDLLVVVILRLEDADLGVSMRNLTFPCILYGMIVSQLSVAIFNHLETPNRVDGVFCRDKQNFRMCCFKNLRKFRIIIIDNNNRSLLMCTTYYICISYTTEIVCK